MKEEGLRLLQEATPETLKWLEKDWRSWCRDKQLPPDGRDWSKWLVVAGRGFGKTRLLAEWVRSLVVEEGLERVNVVGATADDARDTLVEGEALSLSTPLPTPAGWKTMGEVKAGDELFDEQGKVCRILWVSPIYYERPCYRVTLTDGSVFTADANHKWLIYSLDYRQAARQRERQGRELKRLAPAILTTEQLATSNLRRCGQLQYAIPVTEGLELARQESLLIPPYVLGAWLGDGHSYHAAITTMDQGILDRITEAGYCCRRWPSAKDGGRASTYGILKLGTQLRAEGLFGNKHVPSAYLRGSREQRLEVLRGLMDTDGYVSKRGQCEFSNTNPALARAVHELACSLGIKAVVRTKRGKHKPLYRVRFQTHEAVFTLARKLERIRPDSGTFETKIRSIAEIRAVDSVPVRCLAVSSPSHLFLAGEAMVPTHNSGILAVCRDDERPKYIKAERKLAWPTGATTLVLTAEEPERARGKQHQALGCDELGCLVAGTMVATEHGPVPIEQVLPGTRVHTREGLRPVRHAWQTDTAAVVYRLSTSGGRVVTGTANHRFWVEGQGWRELRCLGPGDIIRIWNPKSSPGTNSGGIEIDVDTTGIAGESCCTGLSTAQRTVQFLKDWKSTIETAIQETIASIILKHCLALSTQGVIPEGEWPVGSPKSGGRFPSNPGNLRNQLEGSAPTVRENSGLPDNEQDSVISTARWLSTDFSLRSKLRRFARGACALSGDSTATQDSAPAIAQVEQDVVLRVEQQAVLQPVYDLEVEGVPEFYANGILVHNSWRYPDTWTQLMLGLRLPPWPRVLVTTTPRPTPLMKRLINDPTAVVVKGTTYENQANLAQEFYDTVITEYEGTRLGRQELLAELLTDNPGALWQVDLLEKNRVTRVPQLQRVIVAVDPQSGLEKSETGIIVAGKDRDGRVYVLEDATVEGTPELWGSRVVRAAKAHQADSIVYEANQGGEMVRAILAQALRDYGGLVPRVESVRATRGKATRAEPVAHLYEQGRVHHLGVLARLEDQLCEWVPGQRESPDRMDALVWAVTSLGVGYGESIVLSG